MRGVLLKFAGNYVIGPGSGYAICMPLNDSCDNRSNHHDAYLLALASEAGLTPSDIGNPGLAALLSGPRNQRTPFMLQRSGSRSAARKTVGH